MSDALLDLPDCPDAAGLVSPPALPPGPILADCSVPAAPPPVYSCPPPTIPTPPTGGSVLFHVRISSRDGDVHSWEAVESDGAGGWTAEGRTGSEADGAEAYEQSGASTRPGPAVYLARRVPGTRKLVFENPRTPFPVKLSGTGPAYDWAAVKRDGAGAWVAVGGPGNSGTAADGDGARLVDDGAADPDAAYTAQRNKAGDLDVYAAVGSGGGGPGPGGTATSLWCVSPASGVPPATGALAAREPTTFVADVYASAGAATTLFRAGATVAWWQPDACGAGKLLAVRPAGTGFDALTESCSALSAPDPPTP